MFKKLVMGAIAAASMTASAYAADLPSRAPAPMLPPPPVFTWTGFYVGVNGGGAFTRAQSLPYFETFGNAPFFPAAGVSEFGPLPSRSGGFGGGQLGINWQTGMFVFGAELDAQAARINSTVSGTIAPYLAAGNAISIATTQRIDYFGTARGRVGIAFGGPGWWGPGGYGGGGFGGSVLVYATGGFAYAGVRDGFLMTDTFGFTAANIGNNGRVGYAAGGGIEWMFLPNWSIKGEYQYIDLRRGPAAAAVETVGGLGTAFAIHRVDPRIQMHTARIGLNYHFTLAPPAPVVARY
ncbi:MAG: outer rane immunogenic protein [Methylobacteriaceae bacterium]|jgi:outer membrane immunogenic protein|nr:outer rane immunogenic protein [Methylobacteriaceae bacterium]